MVEALLGATRRAVQELLVKVLQEAHLREWLATTDQAEAAGHPQSGGQQAAGQWVVMGGLDQVLIPHGQLLHQQVQVVRMRVAVGVALAVRQHRGRVPLEVETVDGFLAQAT